MHGLAPVLYIMWCSVASVVVVYRTECLVFLSAWGCCCHYLLSSISKAQQSAHMLAAVFNGKLQLPMHRVIGM